MFFIKIKSNVKCHFMFYIDNTQFIIIIIIIILFYNNYNNLMILTSGWKKSNNLFFLFFEKKKKIRIIHKQKNSSFDGRVKNTQMKKKN